MKRILPILTVFHLGAIIMALWAQDTVIDPSDPGILYTGRFEFSNPSKPVFSHVGCSIQARFNGTGISANFSSMDSSYLYVIIDDNADIYNRKILHVGSSEQTFILASGLEEGIHTVEIVKMNQYDKKVTFHNFSVDGTGFSTKPERPTLALEFYGDSNAAGSSAWDPKDRGGVRYNGSFYTFPAITARMLNAEFSNISGGGAGITNNGWWSLVPYHHLIHMNDPATGANIWDFENNFWNFSPDAVIINLGANDYSSGVSKSEIKSGWKNFITDNLRIYYPDAHIVLVNSYGWAYNEPADYVHEAIEELNSAGENNVSFLRFPWLWSQAHAVVYEHAGFANLLAAHLATELNLAQPQPNELSSFVPRGQVVNGSFEKSVMTGKADGWRFTGSKPLITDPATAFEGDNYLRLVNGALAHYANDASPNETFTVTAWMKAVSGSQANLKIEFKDQAQNIISSGTVEGLKSLTNEWQHFTTTGTAPENTWQVNVVLKAAAEATIDFDDVRMVFSPSSNTGFEGKYAKEFRLYQNYPNPFNPKTIINYELPITNDVSLIIYDIRGRKVDTLISARQAAGLHHVEWDASDLSSGIYFIKLAVGDDVQIKKSILLK